MAHRELTPSAGSRSPTSRGRDPFTSFRREMDRLFDDFFSPAEPRSFGGGGVSWPTLDVEETDQAYTVKAEVAGLDQKDIKLELRDNVLELSGEKRDERKDETDGRTYSERFYGSFHRSIPLQSEVDADKVEATFKNGLLTVVLPKNDQARDKTRRIEIKS